MMRDHGPESPAPSLDRYAPVSLHIPTGDFRAARLREP